MRSRLGGYIETVRFLWSPFRWARLVLALLRRSKTRGWIWFESRGRAALTFSHHVVCDAIDLKSSFSCYISMSRRVLYGPVRVAMPYARLTLGMSPLGWSAAKTCTFASVNVNCIAWNIAFVTRGLFIVNRSKASVNSSISSLPYENVRINTLS